MEDVKIIDTLGSGMFGTTFLVSKEFALKRQKIRQSDMTPNMMSSVWREIKFYGWINNLHPDDQHFFTKLYDYKIYRKCNFKNKIKFKITDPELKKLVNNLNKNEFCLDYLLQLKSGVIFDLVSNNKLKIKQKYSLIVQMLYTLYILSEAQFYHGDIHLNNIAFSSAPNHITLFLDNKTVTIPSHGYYFSLIDYGLVLHPSFDLTEKEKVSVELFKTYNKDLITFFDSLLIGTYIVVHNKEITFINIKKMLRPCIILIESYPKLWDSIKEQLYLMFPQDKTFKKQISYFEKTHLPPEKSFMPCFLFIDIIFAVFDKKLYCKLRGLGYKPNFIDDEHLKFILNNYGDFETMIKYFIKLL